jgi:hypothetical protein
VLGHCWLLSKIAWFLRPEARGFLQFMPQRLNLGGIIGFLPILPHKTNRAPALALESIHGSFCETLSICDEAAGSGRLVSTISLLFVSIQLCDPYIAVDR